MLVCFGKGAYAGTVPPCMYRTLLIEVASQMTPLLAVGPGCKAGELFELTVEMCLIVIAAFVCYVC